jgi:predicted dehydrogenase
MKNICIVGCGKMGEFHSKKLCGFSNLFFHSRSKSSAKKLLNKFGGKYFFTQFEDVIQSPAIDAVVISSPPEFHKEQIIKSLQVGKSVLVEKPMCISEVELAEIGKVVDDLSDAFLMVAENYYYKPSLKRMKQLLKDQYIGEIQSVLAKKHIRQRATGWKTQYGALLEGGIHFIALISDLFNVWPEKIDAYFPYVEKDGVERHSVTKLAYKSNATATLSYSWVTKSFTKGTFQKSYIIGDKGTIIFESNGIYIFLRSNKKNGLYLNISDLMGYNAMIKDFLKCLEDKQRIPYSDFHKASRDLSIVFQAYKYLRA